MKKIVLSVLAIASFACANAQTPSYGLDTWTATACSTVKDPVGWASFNVLNCVGMPKTVDTIPTAMAYSGITAAKITTAKIPTFVTVPGYDTVGLLVLGSISLSGTTPTIKYGTPYIGRPAVVTFATQYSSPSLDTGWVRVDLTKWNSGTSTAQIIATGLFQTSATSSVWTLRTINLTSSYTSTSLCPDSMKIYCSSSSLYRPKIGSSLSVDAFTFTGWVSTNDISGIRNSVSVYPNPANNMISLECTVDSKAVEIMDISGRKIGSYDMLGNKTEIQTSSFSEGLYIYQVIDKNNQVLNRGKFDVAH